MRWHVNECWCEIKGLGHRKIQQTGRQLESVRGPLQAPERKITALEFIFGTAHQNQLVLKVPDSCHTRQHAWEVPVQQAAIFQIHRITHISYFQGKPSREPMYTDDVSAFLISHVIDLASISLSAIN